MDTVKCLGANPDTHAFVLTSEHNIKSNYLILCGHFLCARPSCATQLRVNGGAALDIFA